MPSRYGIGRYGIGLYSSSISYVELAGTLSLALSLTAAAYRVKELEGESSLTLPSLSVNAGVVKRISGSSSFSFSSDGHPAMIRSAQGVADLSISATGNLARLPIIFMAGTVSLSLTSEPRLHINRALAGASEVSLSFSAEGAYIGPYWVDQICDNDDWVQKNPVEGTFVRKESVASTWESKSTASVNWSRKTAGEWNG